MADNMPPAVDDDLQELIAELMEADLQDPELEQSLTTVLSLATNYLDDPDPPSPELADWAATLETNSTIIADGLASRLLDFRRGLAVFAGTGRPEKAVLRKHVAWVDARRADAADIASAARRLLEKELRCFAARDHPVDPEVAELITAMRESTKSRVLQDSSGGDAVRRAGLLDIAIKFEDAVVEEMTALKEKLTRGAAVFFAGEEELVQALQKHAATAEAEIAEAQAFSAVLLADANRTASPVVVVQKRAAPETETETEEEPPRQRRRTGDAGDSAAQD
ncbi:Os10g0570900 [Oryza sativa Japonica Group]|uniref:Os10g0570900 protein n=3 Tax=Oryza TaxID=4527 RepID=Q108W7_ORYSJ|nr:hypothetical protein LOC_Os10g42072 [Oryza sativa Japonica Group]EAY79600.1 hypothetical protein OsI_34740 [Oryza sativa Indica Group]KAF2914917.1 hypothetical protein DAI22_10g200100 [Oryza sativa Japonica Group]BAT12155.1 Os10g0570900 [Oryza sativa Japonica Group]